MLRPMHLQGPDLQTPVPPPPPFALSTDLEGPDEVDVDLADDDGDDDDQGDDEDNDQGDDDDHQLHADTVAEEIEFMGEAGSLEDYFKMQLEELVDPCIHWIFDALDMDEVQRRFEGGRYRYIMEGRAVYRTGLPLRPTPGDDAPAPWMPTRGS